MTDADDLALYASTPVQVGFRLHRLEEVASGISFYVKVNKIEHMYFKQELATSTLNCQTLKLVNQFTYLGSNISSTEICVNICLEKTWTAINGLS